MSRPIDGDKLKRKVQKVATEAWKMKLTARVETVLNQCIDYIDNAPTIEPSAQPEIIYCKKCKHWTRTCGDEQWSLGDCDVFDKHLVMCNGYCAWAERREDGNG